jgi:phenylacetate-CoA ligase
LNLYSKLLENCILPLADLFTGSNFIGSLKGLRKLNFLEKDALVELQQGKLMKLLSYAINNSKYYRDLEIGINWNDNSFDIIKKFPILDKTLLKKHEDDLVTVDKNKTIRQVSSGSSGVQSTVYWTREEQSINRATQILFWEWAGYKIGDPLIQTGLSFERSIFKKIKDILFNTTYVLAFSHSENDVLKALKKAKQNKRTVLAGYASSLYVFAQIAEKNKLNVEMKTVISWGDKMFDHYRKKIEQVFNTKVHETYGTTEGMMIGAQMDLNFMYQLSSHVFLEILDDDGNEVPDGAFGNVVVTNLNGFGMPLIRYKIGDLAIKLDQKKYPPKCKLNFPILEKVIGRDTDLVKTKLGKTLTVHSFTGIIEHFPEIIQFCVIQEKLEGVKIKFIKGMNFSHFVLTQIESKVRQHLGEADFKIEFEEVDYIAPTKSGKPQIIISSLK